MKAVFLAFLCTWLCLIGLMSCAGVHYASCDDVEGIKVLSGNVTCETGRRNEG